MDQMKAAAIPALLLAILSGGLGLYGLVSPSLSGQSAVQARMFLFGSLCFGAGAWSVWRRSDWAPISIGAAPLALGGAGTLFLLRDPSQKPGYLLAGLALAGLWALLVLIVAAKDEVRRARLAAEAARGRASLSHEENK